MVAKTLISLVFLLVAVFGDHRPCRIGDDDAMKMMQIANTKKLLLMEAAVSGDTDEFDEFVALNTLYDFTLESHVTNWGSLAEFLDPNSGVIATIRAQGTVRAAIINSGANLVAECELDDRDRKCVTATFPNHIVYDYEEYTAETDELRSVKWIEAEPGCWRIAAVTLEQFSRQVTRVAEGASPPQGASPAAY